MTAQPGSWSSARERTALLATSGPAPSAYESARASIADVVARLRAGYRSGVTRPLEWRQGQLGRLVRLLRDNEDELLDALAADLGKPRLEGYLSEVGLSAGEIDATIRALPGWMRDEKVKLPLAAQPGRGYIHREPLGVALVIGAWNYPVQLVVLPMASAIAAGNTVVIKPSELAPATSAALARLVPRYLDARTTVVIEGGPVESAALLAERFDHILYTGGGRVGRIVLRAAAEHLTPVTLELGGKNPVLIDADANVRVAARRIAWGKFFNAGQTCLAPDYVLVHDAVHDQLIIELVSAVRSFYGEDPRHSPDYARIVNDGHFGRLAGLLEAGGFRHLVAGGCRDAADRYFAPTLLDQVDDGAAVMVEEIFGPLLPVLPVRSIDEAVGRVNERDHALSLYAFTRSKDTARRILDATGSGAVVVNHVMLQAVVPNLPFGGVGPSGMGAYHGRTGFETFSHRRAVLTKPTRPDPPIMYPPYTGWKNKVIRRVL